MRLLKNRINRTLFFTVIILSRSSIINACEIPFGNYIGESHTAEAYSNFGCENLNKDYNFIKVKDIDNPIFSGLKWQCVEYARRFLIVTKGITFENIDYAFQIWDLTEFEDIYTNNKRPISHLINNLSTTPPKNGDLLIYSDKLVYTGHVAVILEVEPDFVSIGEQNHSDSSWEEIHYSRKLPLLKDEFGKYSIIDEAIIGWIHVLD